MTLLDWVVPPWVKILIPLVLGAFLVLGVAHYNNVVDERDSLSSQLKAMNKSIEELEANAKAALERQKDMEDIKREIHEIPSSSIPADIQHTLDRLRER